MRKVMAAVILTCAVFAAGAWGQPAPRSIAVSGTVSYQVAPDQIIWSIGITDEHPDNLMAAKQSNDVKVKKVLALQEKLALRPQDITTNEMYVSRQYNHDDRGQQKEFRGFSVNRRMAIVQRDLKKYDEFIDALLTSADMDVSYNYESSTSQTKRSEARKLALQAAESKAKEMAATLHAKVGKPLLIQEYNRDGGYYPMNNMRIVNDDLPLDARMGTFAPGNITQSITVLVTFELLD